MMKKKNFYKIWFGTGSQNWKMPQVTVIKGNPSYWENAIIGRKMQTLFWENYRFFAFRLFIYLRINVQATPQNTKSLWSCCLGSGTTANRDRLAFSPEVFCFPLVPLNKSCWSVRKIIYCFSICHCPPASDMYTHQSNGNCPPCLIYCSGRKSVCGFHNINHFAGD